jgi:hypothetical protein
VRPPITLAWAYHGSHFKPIDLPSALWQKRGMGHADSIHPDVMRLLEQHFPKHPTDDAFWQRLKAEASDDFRPEIKMPLYRLLVLAKIRFAIDGPTADVQREVEFIILTSARNMFQGAPLNLPAEDNAYYWLSRECKSFERHVQAALEVPDLEREIIDYVSGESGRNLWHTTPDVRSRAFLKYLDDTGYQWEGLPLDLMAHILTRFAERDRDSGFWLRIQQSIGTEFSASDLEYPKYVELLNLQIRAYGFRDSPSVLLPLVEDLRIRMGDMSTASAMPCNTWSLRISDLATSLKTRQAGRDPSAGPGCAR